MSDILHVSALPSEAQYAIRAALETVRQPNGAKAMIHNIAASWNNARRWTSGTSGNAYALDLAAVLTLLTQVGTDCIASNNRVRDGKAFPAELVAGQAAIRERLIDGVIIATKILAEALIDTVDRLDLERSAARRLAEPPTPPAVLTLSDGSGSRSIAAKPVEP